MQFPDKWKKHLKVVLQSHSHVNTNNTTNNNNKKTPLHVHKAGQCEHQKLRKTQLSEMPPQLICQEESFSLKIGVCDLTCKNCVCSAARIHE